MLKMVDGTGIIGVDMVCPLGVSAPQPPNYDRVELEGTGMLVLPNSLDAPLERLELGGKTEQVQTTGAQLLKPKDGSYTVFGVSVDIANGEIKLSGTATSSGGRTIRLSEPFLLKAGTYSSEVDGKIDFILSKNSDNSYLTNLLVKNFNVNEDTEVYVGLNVMAQNTYNNKYHIMLNSGNIPLPYEPYTGGKPSPSPEYPQEIKNVGKWNEETQKCEVDVKVTGKNLFDKDSVKKGYEFSSVASDMESPREGWFVSDFISVAEGKVYISGKSTGGGCKLYNKDKLFVKNIQATSGQLTIEEGISYFRLNGETKDLNNIQVELGSVSTTYEPYRKLQTLTLTSDRPITKWDRLVEQGGQYGWLYKHKIIEDFSTLVKDTEPIYGNDGGKYFSVSLQNASLNYDRSKIYSEVGVYGKDNKIHYIPQPMMANAIIHVSDTDTIMTAKEHMHYKVIYETIESQFVPLPQSEQNAIRALKTYYPTTVITADGGELDPDIKVTYRKEI